MHTFTALVLTVHLGAAPAAFQFNDAADHQGRSMLNHRAIEFHDAPVQALAGDFSAPAGAMYGQLPVGSSPQTALAVVWLPKAEDGPVLWFDADGNGRLATGERHVISGREFEIKATIAVSAEGIRRTILLRRPILGAGLRYAVRGYALGTLELGSQRHAAILADGNADGLLDTAGQDRLWIDLDDNGQFDGLTEQFPLGKPILQEGRVYVIRSDPLASAVVVNVREPGEGRLRLGLAGNPRVEKFSGELVSDLGELFTIDKLDEAVGVPYGQYRVTSLQLQVNDTHGQPWDYSFERSYQQNRADFSVPKGGETAVALLGKLAMQVSLDVEGGKARPSQTVTVRPQVVSADQPLYLAHSGIAGNERLLLGEASAQILLLSPQGEPVDRGVSGFS